MTVPHSGLLEWKLKDRFVNVAAARLTRDNLSSRISRHLDFFVKKTVRVSSERERTHQKFSHALQNVLDSIEKVTWLFLFLILSVWRCVT